MRLRRRKRPRRGLDELVRRTRAESRGLARRQRVARRALPRAEPFEGLRVRVKGTALESRRRLRPVLAPVWRLISRAAPYVTGALLLAIRLVAAVVALVLDVAQGSIRWLALHGVDSVLAGIEVLRRVVTPLRTAAFVGIAAAVALAASQFYDYRGVAVDAPAYAGELGATAPVPITDREDAGSAHAWILLPVAAAAVLLVLGAYRRRGRVVGARLAAAVALCGFVGLVVALAIDLPQGLDKGRAAIAFTGTEARLLEGFWAEIAASAVLILSGALLALYSREVRIERRRRHREDVWSPAAAASSNQGVSPGFQAGS